MIKKDVILENALTDISDDKRSCKLFGFLCVADFDISLESLSPIFSNIYLKLQEPRIAYDLFKCDDVNIGLYFGGAEIRCWQVSNIG